MQCPNCKTVMEQGQLDLKAWGLGLFPQAQLHFDEELLVKNQYYPITGFFREGTKASAYRCRSCKLVCFEYGDGRRPTGHGRSAESPSL